MQVRDFKDPNITVEAPKDTKRAPCDWATCHKIKARPEESLFLLREYHIVRVLEGALRRRCRKCHVNQSGSDASSKYHKDSGGKALALVFSLKLVSAQDWGACVPSRHRALNKGQSQRVVGSPRGTQGREVNRLTARVSASQSRRSRKASPKRGIAKRETSPSKDIAREASSLDHTEQK